MKQLLLLVTLVVFVQCISAQNAKYFSGKIVYTNSIESTDTFFLKSLKKDMAVTNTLYINSVNYKTYFNASWGTKQIELYNSGTDSYYLYTNAAKEMEIKLGSSGCEDVSIAHNAKKENILGYDCSSVTLTIGKVNITYYYSDSLKLAPGSYKNHCLDNWNKYMAAANYAVPLKVVYHSGPVTYSSLAITITPIKFRAKDFKLSNVIPDYKAPKKRYMQPIKQN